MCSIRFKRHIQLQLNLGHINVKKNNLKAKHFQNIVNIHELQETELDLMKTGAMEESHVMFSSWM